MSGLPSEAILMFMGVESWPLLFLATVWLFLVDGFWHGWRQRRTHFTTGARHWELIMLSEYMDNTK